MQVAIIFVSLNIDVIKKQQALLAKRAQDVASETGLLLRKAGYFQPAL
jgi:hypothetical protein